MRAPPSKPIRVVSLFCGIGAADLGLYAAAEALGIELEVVDAIDSWEPAVRVYNANMRHPVARVGDVKNLTKADLPPHDLIIGGPPCQDHSLAGLRKCQCHLGGFVAERCCLADFLRLAGNTPYLMENVASRLIPAPFSVKLNAFDYGDVTTRKRWFYSDHLLDVIPTRGARRFGDIRDHEADRTTLERRAVKPAYQVAGQKYPTQDDVLGSLTSGKGGSTGFLKVGLRGHSASASASAFEDDEPLGSLISNSWHGNELSRLGPTVRCPSLLEMARAHSIPDSFDWVGTTKTNKGKMIANCWPVGMATAVGRAMLVAMGLSSPCATHYFAAHTQRM
jgi:site-specific DNA-cytosine methylase